VGEGVEVGILVDVGVGECTGVGDSEGTINVLVAGTLVGVAGEPAQPEMIRPAAKTKINKLTLPWGNTLLGKYIANSHMNLSG